MPKGRKTEKCQSCRESHLKVNHKPLGKVAVASSRYLHYPAWPVQGFIVEQAPSYHVLMQFPLLAEYQNLTTSYPV